MDKLDKIYAIANNALYFDDNSDFGSALWEICNEINPDKEKIGKDYIDKED